MGLNTDAFSTGIRKARGLMEEFKGSVGGVGGMLNTAFAGFGAGLSVVALISASKHLMEFAKQITITSEELGVSTTFLQQWDYAARKTGVDSESAEKGLGKLNVKIGEARAGNQEAIAAFEKWGISLKDSAGHVHSVQDVVEAASKRINEIEDPTQRAAMAFELFGKGGVKLVESLKDLDALKAKSNGRILDEADIARLDSAEKRIA